MTTLPAPARATYDLTADQAADLHRAATPWHPGSQARADPLYRDRLNNWWAALGLELGFKWTTVADLTWLGVAGKPCAISEESGEGYGLPNFAEVMGATFTAEPEVAIRPADAEAARWCVAWLEDNHAPDEVDAVGPWASRYAMAAFAAGRDKGFAMGTATVDALERQLGIASAARTACARWMNEGQALVREAAALFRHYEQHHQTKLDEMLRGPRGATEHGELLGKVRRNAVMAARLESYLEAFNVRWEAAMDTRSREERQRDIILAGRCVVIPLERAELADDLDEEEPAPVIPRGLTHASEDAQRFSTNDPGFDPRQFVTINGFMFTPQAELETLRQLLADAMPAIHFVNGLATIEDADLDTFAVAQLRNQARGSMGDDGFKRPGTYTDDQRAEACVAIRRRYYTGEDTATVAVTPSELVDMVAEALGLRRAS